MPVRGTIENLTGDTILAARVVLTAAATLLAAARRGRCRITIKNIDTAITIYIGASAVATADGLELKPGESYASYTTAAVYAIPASGTPSVSILEEYN